MENKLQQLTDKLYNEGLSKGKKEADELLAKAKAEAAELLQRAKEEREAILAKAQKEADELKLKSEGDIKMSASQTLATVKEQISAAIKTEAVAKPVEAAMSDVEFMKGLLKSIVEAYNPKEEAQSLEAVLPQSLKEGLESYAKTELGKICSKGLDVKFERDLKHGFKISPKGSGYYIDFTSDAFEALISQYLRPKTKKLLFG